MAAEAVDVIEADAVEVVVAEAAAEAVDATNNIVQMAASSGNVHACGAGKRAT